MHRTCAVLITRCSRQLVPRVTFWSQNEYETKENVKRPSDTKRIEWFRLKTRDRVLTSGKRAFGQAPLVPAVIWAGTKGLATSPQIRPPARQPLVPVRYNPLVPVWDTNRD
jgi:hypothetical protein